MEIIEVIMLRSGRNGKKNVYVQFKYIHNSMDMKIDIKIYKTYTNAGSARVYIQEQPNSLAVAIPSRSPKYIIYNSKDIKI